MRIATGGISHETSTFAKTPTTLREFETGFGLFRGSEILSRFRGANTCTGGFIDGAAKHKFELVPLLWTFAYPGGLIRAADYEALKAEFLDRLRREEADRGPVDGALLDLHGAMVVEGIDCAAMKYIAVKSAAHFRAAFEPIAGTILNVDAQAIHTHDFTKLKYRRRNRAVFPVEIPPGS
jgi:microcystin degradation protein MlrC